MPQHVSLKVDLLNEAFLADLASKRPLSVVSLAVLLQLEPRLEPLAALVAGVAPRPLHLLVHRPDVVI